MPAMGGIATLLLVLSVGLCASQASQLRGAFTADTTIITDGGVNLAFPLSDSFPVVNTSQITVPFCNHYAVNRGSVVYSPCSASYLVASENFGAILPPNMCSGEKCPISGDTTPTVMNRRCDKFTFGNGTFLTQSTTTLFDSYCDYLRLNSRRCVPSDRNTGPRYRISPPIFTATTNWCDPRQIIQPPGPGNKISLTTGEADYPFTFASPTQTMDLGKHTCPGDMGYGAKPGPSTNDVVLQICLPGCQSVVAPVTVTLNLRDEIKRKKEGSWYWKMGVWDFKTKGWQVLCDSTKTSDNLNRQLDIAEVVVPADLMTKYMDPTSKCLLFAPITNYKGCPGRPYTGITPGEAAAMAAVSMFVFMLLIQLCICSCIITRAKLLIQPPQQQVVYVESPQPVNQIIEKVVERIVPQSTIMQMGNEQVPVQVPVQGYGQQVYTTASFPNYPPGYPQNSVQYGR